MLLADAQFERPDRGRDRLRRARAPCRSRSASRPHAGVGAPLPACPSRRSSPTSAPRRAPAPTGCRSFGSATAPTPKFAEFADAKTLIRLNARPLGRDTRALRAGDLLYFRQPGQKEPDHLMVFVGRSHLRIRRRRLGRVSHRPARWRPGRSAQGPARHACATSGASLAAARLESAVSSACSDWECYEDGTIARPLLLVVLLACIRVARIAQADADDRPAFSLSTSEVFTTRDAPSFYLTFRRVPHLDFRVYKVRDPFAFFAGPRRSAPVRHERSQRRAGAHVARALRRLEARAAPGRAALRARAGQSRVSRRPPRRQRQGRSLASASCSTPTPLRRCRCSMPTRWSRRGASCCRTTAMPKCGACRSISSSRASTSSRPSTTCCAPTPS